MAIWFSHLVYRSIPLINRFYYNSFVGIFRHFKFYYCCNHALPLSSFFPIWQNLILQNASSACNCQKSTEIRISNSWKLNKHFGNILVCFVFNKQLLHSTAQSELKTIKLFLQSTFSAYDLWKSCKNIDLHKERWRGSNINIYAQLNNAQLHIPTNDFDSRNGFDVWTSQNNLYSIRLRFIKS